MTKLKKIKKIKSRDNKIINFGNFYYITCQIHDQTFFKNIYHVGLVRQVTLSSHEL